MEIYIRKVGGDGGKRLYGYGVRRQYSWTGILGCCNRAGTALEQRQWHYWSAIDGANYSLVVGCISLFRSLVLLLAKLWK
jgi:hypothetical protein